MDLEYFVVAESIAVDAHTNRVSIFNVLEVVEEQQVPIVLPLVCSVAVFRTTDADSEIDWQAMVKVHTPGAKPIAFPANFKIQKGAPRYRLLHRLEGVPVHVHGDVRVELELNGQHVAEHWIHVTKPDTTEA